MLSIYYSLYKKPVVTFYQTETSLSLLTVDWAGAWIRMWAELPPPCVSIPILAAWPQVGVFHVNPRFYTTGVV